MKKPYWMFLAAVFFASCSTSPVVKSPEEMKPIDRLRAELAERFDDPNFMNAHWGVVIRSLKTGEVVYQRNEYKSFMPASNMKLFTTSTALTSLTPDFRYKTDVYAEGDLKAGVLTGNIVVKGSGDPTISGRYNNGHSTETFEQWADSLKAAGITEVTGNVIGDDRCFDESFYGDGWDALYETDWYAAQFGGLAFNDNCVDMTVTAGDSVGQPAHITWSPATKYISIVNKTKTTGPDSNYYITFTRRRGTNIVTVSGSFPVNKPAWKESIAIDNPTLYAATVLKETLERKGIAVHGEAMDIGDTGYLPDYASARHVATFTSIPLSEIVRTINKPSQNFYAEQLYRTMGMAYYGLGSERNSRRVTNPIFASWGIDTLRLQEVDGSGLSRLNLVSPTDVVSLLTGMYQGKYFEPFYQSLPIAGVDGSIRNRMKGTKAENNVHAKTGFVGYVRALSGYVTSRDGEMFVFSMICNHYTVPTRMAEKIQNDVCIRLAEFSRTE
ncbi:MAG: D-alanyl-D-alanine carboxypeptidase/D-alanyl-D-alanine-endopeptidase [Acidobacteriota bacterium]